jgi:predicted amidohydrolase YtcJ
MRCWLPVLTAFLSWVVPAGVAAAESPADLVLRNGKIVTLDERNAVVQALATRGGRILAVGPDADVAKLIGPKTTVLDLGGKLAIPGFIEGHGHFVSLGQSRMMLDLRKAQTWDEIVHQVEEAAKKTPAGEWILGRGWHQEKWTVKPEPQVEGYPIHTRLSEVTPRHPVLLTHASGHMSFANAEAMRLAGVAAATPNPAGGEILKDAQGNPTGIFRETAQGLLGRARGERARPRSAEEQARDLDTAIRLAQEECLAKGVTSFQEAGSSLGTIDAFRRLADQGKLQIRLWVMVRAGNEEMAQRLADYRMIGHGDNHLTVRAIKRSIDGALGPHGAWLLEPYEDLRGSTGLNTSSVASIQETARLALRHDYQLCIHAIGDRANRETLNLFEEAFRQDPRAASRRWRIEHAQHLHPDDIPRFAKLGVIASMQGIHCTSDAVYVLQRLGLRRAAQGAYVWQSLIKSGAVVSNGTDTPVEDVDPIACYYASVTRKLANGTGFFPEQKMTREQALRSYTIQAAYAAFEEDLKGTLAPGKLADVVVLSRDILTVPDEQIRDTRVVYTIIGGQIVHRQE